MKSHQLSAISRQPLASVFSVVAFLLLIFSPFSSSAWAKDIAPENECVRCHLEQEEEDEDLALPPKEWRDSIHYTNSIACNDCHGGDPNGEDEDEAHDADESEFIGAPADDDIPRVCGECHVAVLENYVKSKHWNTKKEKRPVCITCHEAHPIKKATLDLINEDTCTECHKYERSKRIKVAMAGTESKLIDLDRRIHALKSEGMDARSLEKTHFAQRNVFHRLSHSLDLDEVIQVSESVNEDTKILSASIDREESLLKQRKVWGGALTLFLLFGTWIMHRRRKALDEEEPARGTENT